MTGSDAAIEVRDVRLAYRLTRNRAGTLKEYAISMLKRQIQYEQLWAVDGVSFEVKRGEVFGVIGPNGAGKSTLMKIIARVLPPTEGRVIVRGSVAPMIELGAGFNQEMTAYENIVLNGTLLGRDPATMRRRAPEIVAWAGLEEFMNVPIRSFSTGMMARLGFAVATDERPDVLVVDEVLSVGDANFQRRSKKRIQDMIHAGTAVVLVSHDLVTVNEVGNHALWLDHGHPKMLGDARDVVRAYTATTGDDD